MASGKKSSVASAEAPASGGRNRRRRNKKVQQPDVIAPVAVSQMQVSKEPKISTTAKSVRIAHRELVLSSCTGKEVFTVTSTFYVNPGLADYFPWLSTQAAKWECYRFIRFRLIYVATCPSSSPGSIILSPDYDVTDQLPSTQAEAENNVGSVSDSVWKTVVCTLDPSAMASLGPRRFIRSSAIAGDQKTFDVARIAVASSGCAAGNPSIGKIYADYEVELFSPQMYPRSPLVASSASIFHNTASVQVAAGAERLVAELVSDDDPLRVMTSDGITFIPPAGTYRVFFSCFGVITQNAVAQDITLKLRKDGAIGDLDVSRYMDPSRNGGDQNYLTLDTVARTDGSSEFEFRIFNNSATAITTANVRIIWSLI